MRIHLGGIAAELTIAHMRSGYPHQHTKVPASARDAGIMLNRIVPASATIGRQGFMTAA
jgi:hypothetical protein